MFPCSLILLPVPISRDRPPLHHILPCELRRHILFEDPLLLLLIPAARYEADEGRWGLAKMGGEGKHSMKGGAEQHKYHIVNIYMAALHGSRSNH